MILYIIILILTIIIASLIYLVKVIIKYEDRELNELDRYREFFLLLNHWFLLKQKNINISEYLLKRGYHKVLVYGMGAMGFRLCDELSGSMVCVERTVDRAYNTIYYSGGKVYSPDEGLKNISVDVVIVTANVNKDIIKSYMDNETIEVIYLKDIIYSM